MKKLTILIDMDDTLEDLLGAWVSYLNTQYGTNVHKEDIRQWDISVAFPSLSKTQVYEPILLDEDRPAKGWRSRGCAETH